MNDSMFGAPSAASLMMPNADAGDTVDLHCVGVASFRSGFSTKNLAFLKLEDRRES